MPRSAIARTRTAGLETGAGSLPSEWQLYHGWQGTFARDTTIAHPGHASARISHSTSDSSGGPSFFISPISSHITPGQRYHVSSWVRGLHASGETRITLAWFDAPGHYLGQIQTPVLPEGTTGWTLLSAVAEAPSNASWVQIHCKSFNNADTTRFDDITYR